MKDLPPTDEWDESTNFFSEKIIVPKPPKPTCGKYRLKGSYFICNNCPNPHTLPISPKDYKIQDGTLVKLIK